MSRNLIRRVDDLQEELWTDRLSDATFNRCNRLLNELRVAILDDDRLARRVDPGIDERARQAMLQGRPGELLGRRHDD